MTGRRLRILSTGWFHPDAVALANAACELAIAADDRAETLKRELADADALIVRFKLPGDIFDSAPHLRACVRHGVGVDFIPVEAATRAGIPVANLLSANTEAVVEYVVGIAVMLARDLHGLANTFAATGWKSRVGYAGIELAGRTLGVVGCGHIGRGVAAALKAAFGMRVLGYDRNPVDPASGIEAASLERLFQDSDVITLHVPSTPQTRRMVDARLLGLAKPTAILINAARGDVVDEAALIAALTGGRLRAAAADVFEPEPLADDHPFKSVPNLLLTPHIAGMSVESARRMGVQSIEQTLLILRGERPESLINPEVWDGYLRRYHPGR